jgi:plasmid maintenance system antidote protein VapI
MPRTPIHPGEHLAEKLRALGVIAAELSRQIDVPGPAARKSGAG